MSATSVPVQVVIPCYELARYLPDAVESVVAQTWPDLQCTIVDDGSPDDTSAVAQRLIELFPERRIELLRTDNGGLSAARNAGITAGDAPLVLPLDADDILEPDAVERLVQPFLADPQLAVAYGSGVEFGDRARELPSLPVDLPTLKARNCLLYSSMFRRDAWRAVGGYRTNMLYGYEDWNLWIDVLKRGGRFQQIPGVTLNYRKRGRSMLAEANERRLWLRARMVRNHPELWSDWERELAAELLALDGADPGLSLRIRSVRWLAALDAHDEAAEGAEQLLERPEARADRRLTATLHYIAGKGFRSDPDPARAIRHLQEASDLDPTRVEYRLELAQALRADRQMAAAERQFDDIAELAPELAAPLGR